MPLHKRLAGQQPTLRFQHKIFLSHLTIITVTFILFYCINWILTSRDAETKALYTANQAFVQTRDYLEYMLLGINQKMNQMVFQESIQEVLKRDPDTYSKDKLLQVSDSIRLSKLFYASIAYPIENMGLYLSDKTDLAKEGVNFFSFDQAMETFWYQRAKEIDYNIWYPADYFPRSDGVRYLSLVRKVVNDKNYNQVLGMMRFEIPESVFGSLLNKMKPTEHSRSVIYNVYGEILCTGGESPWFSLSEKDAFLNALPSPVPGEPSWGGYTSGKEKFYVGVQAIKDVDFSMALIIPVSEMMEPYTRFRISMVYVICFIIPVSFVLSYLFSFTNTRKISQLIAHMRKIVQGGGFNVEILPSGKDEIGELVRNYNTMLTRLSMLLEEKYEMGRQLKNLELKSLQAQINPHFLYNTLELINCLSKSANNQPVCDLVQSLSIFYRLSLSRGEDKVTLDNELSHIENYVKIQNMRFEDSIRLIIEVPPPYRQIILPKLTLQPIVENAILHGILERENSSGTIRIHALQEGGFLLVKVTDDGVGMSREKLNTLLTGIPADKTGGFGIQNIHERLVLMFGDGSGLSFTSSPGKGTSVTIRLPANTGQDDGTDYEKRLDDEA